MSYDQDLDKFAGTSRHWVHFDEEPPHTIFNECLARLIDTDGDYWMTMTPIEGMNWIYDEIYEPNVNVDEPKVLVIEINTLENPYLSTNAVESFMEGIDADEVSSRISGQFVRKGGRIYKNFDPTVGGIHVLKDEIEDPKETFRNWLWICALDHGLNNPTAVMWIAINSEGFGVVFDEHYRKEWTVDQHAQEIRRKIASHGRAPDIFVADPSIASRNGITNTSIQLEYLKYGLVWTLGNNDVKAGIVRVKRYWNVQKYLGRRNHWLFPEKDDEGRKIEGFPALRVSPRCVNFIKEAKSYRWKTYSNKKLQYENNPFDEPHKKDDHACDALRYGLMTQPDLFAPKESELTSDRMSSVEQALDNMGLTEPSMMNVADPNRWEVSDPYDKGYGNDAFDGVKVQSSNTEWSYDEHLGIDY